MRSRVARTAFYWVGQRSIAAVCGCLVLASATAVAQRQQVSLNGTWQFKWDNENRLQYPPSDDDWSTIEITTISRGTTGFGDNGTNHWAWYRRRVDVPESMRGQRIKLRLTMVKYRCWVYWNGTLIAEHHDGVVPLEVDVTEKVKFGEPSDLLVGVVDRLGLQRPDLLPYVASDFDVDGSGETDLRPPNGSILGPVSGTEWMYGGIIDHVELVSHPAVWIEDFHITTSVRRSELMLDVTVENTSDEDGVSELDCVVEDEGRVVQRFPPSPVSTARARSTSIRFRKPWSEPHLWSHEDPYLYTLVMRLRDGNRVMDERRFRFGFREFWIEGTQFYLNGHRFRMRRNPFGYPGGTREGAEQMMRELKEIHVNQVRLHHQGFAEWVATKADSIGMTLCPESTFWSRARSYDIDNPEMWKNAQTHWAGVVKMFKNHPSVVMYSIENEMLSTGNRLRHEDPERWDRYVNHWRDVGRLIRHLDPTKPLQASWGHDLEGWLETANIHYVRDAKYYFQVPNDLYWLEGESLSPDRSVWMIDEPAQWRYTWQRDRPLIKGEYGYWYHSNPPHGASAFVGDNAYVATNWYDALWWILKQKYDAYRYAGITANPWLFGEDRGKFFNLHEVFLKDWRANYYGGETMRRTAVVLNEDFHSASLRLDAELSAEGNVIGRQSFDVPLEAGEKWVQDVTMTLPLVDRRQDAELRLALQKDGRQVFQTTAPVHLFPRRQASAYAPEAVGLYDPDGKTTRELTAAGFPFMPVASLDAAMLEDHRVVILGKDAVRHPFYREGDCLKTFVAGGGRVILLEQTAVRELDWLPGKLQVDRTHSSTIAFPMMPDHPLLRDLREDDLKYWRMLHQVSQANFIRPRFWNYTTVAYVGGGDGITHTPLVTLASGKGLFVLTQFRLSQDLSLDPAAFTLLGNMIAYARQYQPHFAQAAVWSPQRSELARILTVFGAVCDRLETMPDSLEPYDVLFLDSAAYRADTEARLRRFVEQGGTLVVRELTPETLGGLQGLLPVSVRVQALPEPDPSWRKRTMRERTCPTRVLKDGNHPLLSGITNFDLYWRTQSGYSQMFGREIAPVARFAIEGPQLDVLTNPGVYAVARIGQGRIVIDQLDWSGGLRKMPEHTSRIISSFLNNLGVELRPNNYPQ